MPTLRQLTVDSLTRLREDGTESLAVDDEARSILRSWMLAEKHKGERKGERALPDSAFRPASGIDARTVADARTVVDAHTVADANTVADASSAPDTRSAPDTHTAPAPRAGHDTRSAPDARSGRDAGASAPDTASKRIPESVEEKLAYLRRRAASWPAAKRLGTLRSTMVFATGNPHARLMLVGEAPGHDEEEQQEPFVGPAGRKLNGILAAMGLERRDVYISNVCKFRPSTGPGQGTSNRAPSRDEIDACLPLILAEIRAIRPGCIVCLGGSAAKGLLGTENSVSSLRGHWLECQGIPVRVTYHPSYLLRNEALSARRAVWEDMLAVMDKLGMPVSERQKHYFLRPRS